MPARTLSSQLPEQAGKPISLMGWVHRIRNLGGVRFLLLRDRAGIAQVIVPGSIDLGPIGSECVVRIAGHVRTEPRAPGGHELLAENIELISPAESPPIEIFKPPQVERTSRGTGVSPVRSSAATEAAQAEVHRRDSHATMRLETLLDHRAITLRIPEVLDIFRITAEIARTFRSSLNARGFTEIFSPKLVLAGAEGGSAVFEVKYYERKAYLGQSPQFYKQMMVGSGLERVFEVGHAYRAEKSETSRHLTEFVSLDFEMGFIESEQDVMRALSETIAAIFEAIRTSCSRELSRRKIALPELNQIPQIDFPEAREILRTKFNKTEGIEGDLDTEGERLIGEWAQQEFNSPLIFVTGYATTCRPVYTMPLASDPTRTRSFDLLYEGVEISTGGQRIHRYDELVESFRCRGLDPASVEGYLEAFRHGMPPHGGMGLGLERFVKQMLRLSNVKEASLFPRDRNRLTP